MFLGTFAWSFVFVSLPFHIQSISTRDAAATLTWTGWILGIAPLVTVLTGPIWGRYAGRGDPRAFYVYVQALQGVAFFGMAVARTLGELFMARLVLGAVGSVSTFAFIMAGHERDPAEVRRRVAAVQSAMTLGQVVGPLGGAVVAARIGFRPSFVFGGAILVACSLFVRWALPPTAVTAPATAGRRRTRPRDVAIVSLVILGGSTQVFFMASVLPQVLPPLGVAVADTLEVGGILLFVSGVAAALGSLVASRIAEVVAERRLLPALLGASSVLLGLQALAGSAWQYGVLRFLQVLCIAPVFPIIVARVAHASGEAVGVINSARIGAAFTGPLVATTVLAWTSPVGLHLVLALIGLACVPLTALRTSPRR